MADLERTRVRERGPVQENRYERVLNYFKKNVERQENGPVVIRPSDREMELSRQGRLTFFLDPLTYPDTPLQEWCVFKHEVRTQSGKHRHQGGIIIYVISGKGYSVVDGERVNWEKGDLMLLPMKPGGVEHQHFNSDPQQPALWIAFIHYGIMEHLAHEITQTQTSPEYKG